MSTLYQNDTWKDAASSSHQPASTSVARKKLEHYSYLLNDNIGKGYSSQVFRGRNDLTGQPVAIKVINMAMLKSEVHQTLLASEIDTLKLLSKIPNIIELYEVYTTKNNTYIITELCEDGDLSRLIKKKKMNEVAAVAYAEQLISGYLHIFRNSILHRDLKPANVFLKGDTLKIADFGFAVKLEDSRKNSNYNVGSPLYMPPEALSHNRYSFKSDIWALGIIFFEMLTGRAPWKAKTEQQLAAKILAEPIQSLLPPDITSASAEFLIKTLNSDVTQRMSPEELQRFSFSASKTVDLRATAKYAISADKNLMKSSRNLSIPRIDAQTPKDVYPAGVTSGQKSTSRREVTASMAGFKMDASCEHQRTDRFNKKDISNQLLSEIHFCRFLYKLIVRIDEIGISETQELKEQLTGVIMNKLFSLASLERGNTAYQLEFYKQYRETNDLRKILNITRQYEEKYKEALQPYMTAHWKEDYSAVSSEVVKTISLLYRRLEYVTADTFHGLKDHVVILDYLITTYQLVELAGRKDLGEFTKKSKIQAIVQGQPTKLGYGHFRAIKDKMARLHLV